jgi:small subunit ribosomal protein S4
MARYTGSSCKLARREGVDLFLKSGASKPLEKKCKLKQPPGQHAGARGGRGASARLSDFALHLREKQKLRRTYGLLERQFRGYYRRAARGRGATGERLIQMLESRLDNLVFRMGFALTRAQARQMVSHKQISVGGRRVSIPSFQVSVGDEIALTDKAKAHLRVKESLALAESRGGAPEWLEVDAADGRGVFRQLPAAAAVAPDINENLIVEYYSR